MGHGKKPLTINVKGEKTSFLGHITSSIKDITGHIKKNKLIWAYHLGEMATG